MTDLDNLCEYFIWWPDKDKDMNTQVCPNWAPSGRIAFDNEDDKDKEEIPSIYIRLCEEHLTEILRRSKPRPKPEPGKEKYYRVRRFTVDQDMDTEEGEIVKEGYDYRGDGYVNELLSVDSNEKEKDKYRYLLENVRPPDKK
jgi:hypothetical protein